MCKVHNHDLVLPLHMYLLRWHFSDTFIELTRMLLHFSLWSSSLHGLLLILMDPHKRQEKHSFNREPDNAARMFSGTVVLQKMKISLRPHSMWSMWPLQECLSSTRVLMSTGSRSVDIVADVYCKVSIKNIERLKRMSTSEPVQYIWVIDQSVVKMAGYWLCFWMRAASSHWTSLVNKESIIIIIILHGLRNAKNLNFFAGLCA